MQSGGPDHFERAEKALSRADTLNVQIRALLGCPKEERDYPEIQRLGGQQRAAMKSAEVHAHLSIAETLYDVHELLSGWGSRADVFDVPGKPIL